MSGRRMSLEGLLDQLPNHIEIPVGNSVRSYFLAITRGEFVWYVEYLPEELDGDALISCHDESLARATMNVHNEILGRFFNK